MSVFGLLVAGRLLQTDFAQVGETQFLTEIPDAESINHIAIFLTGVQPFPDNTAGTVFIRWPVALANGEASWHCLGFISNQKPSAIFKVAQLRNSTAAPETNIGPFASTVAGLGTHGTAQVGISVEPLAEVHNKAGAAGTTPSLQPAMVEFCEKMLRNFANHVESFAVKLPSLSTPGVQQDFIPASAVNDWFNNFQRRLTQNPSFWKSLT